MAEVSAAELSRQAGHPVPTLQQALDRWPDLHWMIEIKVPSACEATIEALSGRELARLTVISFWHDVAEQASRRLEVATGLLICHAPAKHDPWLDTPGRHQALVWNWEFSDEAGFRRAAESGWLNYVYGIQTPPEHQEARQYQLTGIITDTPELLL